MYLCGAWWPRALNVRETQTYDTSISNIYMYVFYNVQTVHVSICWHYRISLFGISNLKDQYSSFLEAKTHYIIGSMYDTFG